MARLLFAQSLGSKGLVLAASAVVHGALALAAGVGFHGRGSAPEPPSIELAMVETNVDLEPVPVHPPEPVNEADVHQNVAAPHHHTHPYPVPGDHDAHPHDPRIEHAHALPTGGPLHDHDADDHDAHDQTPATAGAALAAPEGAPARFTITVGSNPHPTGAVVAAGTGAGGHAILAMPSDEATEIVPEAGVSVRARALSRAEPEYPPAAQSQQVEADVALEIVVDTAGRVVDARVARRAGYGFDEAALAAIRRFRFSPAQRDGRPVRVRMPWTVTFRFK